MSRILVVATILWAMVPHTAAAQRIGASLDMVQGSPRSDLNTLIGARVERIVTTRDANFVHRQGLTVVGRGGRSVGSTCVGGPYVPGQCPNEPIAERRLLVLGSLGFGVQTRPRLFALALHADGLAGMGSIVDRGVESGQKRSASRVLLGIAAGIEVRLNPAASRFQLYAGFDGASLTPFVTECVDCWMPFGGNFGFERWYVGVALREGRSR